MDKIRVFAGITQDNELYFLEIEPKSQEHNYFSMTGETCEPIEAEKAETEAGERLEDGELWRQAVEAESTTQSLADWIDNVLAIDGWESMYDLNNELGTIEVDGVNYVFDWRSVGQHEEKELKHYFIPKDVFDELMKVWEKYHLKDIESVLLPKLPAQDFEELVIEAVKVINGDLPFNGKEGEGK